MYQNVDKYSRNSYKLNFFKNWFAFSGFKCVLNLYFAQKIAQKGKLLEAAKTAKSCSLERQKLPSTIGIDLRGATTSCDTQSKPLRNNLVVVQGWVSLGILIFRKYLRQTL